MNLTTEVHPCLHNSDRWEAALVIDGSPTTFSCSHSHHTAQAAAKCLQAVLERAETIVNDPTFEDVEIDTSKYGQPGGLHEWRQVTGYTAAGTPLGGSTRLWMHRQVW